MAKDSPDWQIPIRIIFQEIGAGSLVAVGQPIEFDPITTTAIVYEDKVMLAIAPLQIKDDGRLLCLGIIQVWE